MWFRRDLRLSDNPALLEAVRRADADGARLLPVYLWEPRERRRWAPGAAARWWLWNSLTSLDGDLRRLGSRLALGEGDPLIALPALAIAAGAGLVVWASGLEPDERRDDQELAAALTTAGIEALVMPSVALLHDPAGPRTRQGRPYTVFTPYWRACQSRGAPDEPLAAPAGLPPPAASDDLTLASLRREAVRPWAAGFEEAWRPGETGAHDRLSAFLERDIATYAEERDRPAAQGTSRLSPHLHWGEVSARQIWHAVNDELRGAGLELEAAIEPSGARSRRLIGLQGSAGAFVRQLGWREFAHHLLHHFPLMTEQPLQPRFDAFPWQDDQPGLAAWQEGRTGYPLVDAGMRELWQTGWMHNRVRLVAASFLVKDLLLAWQAGQDWFWDTLLDADLANNALGWQWVAGSGADAAPFFRIFNPETQRRRYDADGAYVDRWLPEAAAGGTTPYAAPIVEHGEARSRALAAYAAMRTMPA